MPRFLVIMLMLSQSQAIAEGLQLPPIRFWGELGYDFRLETFEGGDDLTENAGIVKLNASSFIYQPWLATVEGGLGLNLRRTKVGSGDSDNDTVVGDGMLRVFPQSRFPFEAFAERSNSNTDGDLSGLDIKRTRYGFLQRYTTKKGAGFRLGYERSDLTNDVTGDRSANQLGDRKDVTDLLRAGFNKAFGAHSINFDSNINNVDRVDSSDRTRTSFSTLRHNYRPSASLSADDMLTYNLTDVNQGNSQFENGLLQLNSFAFWRPFNKPALRANASMRALMRTTETRSSDNTAYSMTPTLGATYEWGPRWVLNGSVGGTGTDTGTDTEVSTFQTANAIFTSRTYMLGGFDASWFGQLDARNNTDDDGSVQGAGAETGYNFGRNLPARTGTIWRVDLRQSITAREATDNFSSQTLRSNVSLGWNRNAGSTSSMMRLTASDSRTHADGDDIGSIEGNFQVVNFQASLDQRFSNTSALLGNMTLQATRDDKPAREGIIDESDGEWNPTASIDLTYFQRLLFGVPRLTFRSTARFISDSYFPVLDESRTNTDRDDQQWENRVDYSIGRLQLRGIARVSRIRELNQTYFLFQVRRLFGDI
ncbi:MAG: hypothetical protein ACR2O5_02725 [Thiogranum sp.]